MCNRFVSPAAADIERMWHVGARNAWPGGGVYPRSPGPFIRAARDQAEPAPDLAIGTWCLIPWFAKTPKLTYSTNNARSEELTSKATFKDPWARGQRCIIPASSFDEPCYETGRNVWWTFKRADGDPWGLAGLWAVWHDRATGQQIESFTMLTINADADPLMSRMHRPDPKLPPDAQDKRSVVPIERCDVEQWLYGTLAQAKGLLHLASGEVFKAAPTVGEPPPAVTWTAIP